MAVVKRRGEEGISGGGGAHGGEEARVPTTLGDVRWSCWLEECRWGVQAMGGYAQGGGL